MAKPFATKPRAAAAAGGKAVKSELTKHAPYKAKHDKPDNSHPSTGKPAYEKKDKFAGRNGGAAAATGASPGSAEVTALVTRMSEKGLAWFDAVKPLKEAPPAPQPTVSKKNKHKQAQQPVLDAATANKIDEAVVQAKKRHAQQLLEQEIARHEAKKSGKMSSDDKYLATMMSKGTLADRVAALTLTIQASPFHSLSRLGQLITMANKKARRESMMAVESLKDLFVNNLLPDDRKLNFFHQNPLTNENVTDSHLVVWFYEHCLKTAFAQLVGVLSNGMQDAVDNHKRACIRAANALLSGKPEQEAVLLGMLVNKIGDPDRKIAAYIHKTLQDLLKDHPLMKRVVVDEVERLLTRAQVSDRTKYNAVLFLNQMMLRKDDEDDALLAAHLIKVFFALFSKEVHGAEEAEKKRKLKAQHKASKKSGAAKGSSYSEGGSMDRKLLSALLMGVNRAFPYSRTATSADLQEEIDTLFKVVRLAKHFPTSVHAMMLLFQVMNSTNSVSDRFYTALYEKLFDAKLRETSKHTLFLNLVFKALKADVSPSRGSAFVKRLMQLTSVMTPAFTCAVLFLLSEVLKIKPQLRTLLDQSESGGSARDDEHFSDQDEDTKKNVFNPEEEEEEEEGDEEDKEEEEEEDALTNADGLSDAQRTAKVLAEMFGGSSSLDEPEKPRAATSFVEESSNATAASSSSEEAKGSAYDCHKRNPLYASAETSCAWEIHHLLHHYHPSVQMFARQLVLNANSGGIHYAGDPLVDFTMHAFFEKFMNKKPKQKNGHQTQTQTQTQNPMDPTQNSESSKSWTFVPINSEALLQEAEESIDATDQFFYKFFKERAQRDAANPSSAKKQRQKKLKKDGRDGDVFSDEDDDDEDEDEDVEAFAQQLAEGIMQDGDMDDEDPELDDWSGPEDGDSEEDGGDLEMDDGDDEVMAFGGGRGQRDDEDDDDDDDQEDDDDDDEEGGAFLDGEEDDDDDEEDDFDFSAMDGELDLPKVAKQKAPPQVANKRKAMFADADDYDTIVREALAKKNQPREKKRKTSEQSEQSEASQQTMMKGTKNKQQKMKQKPQAFAKKQRKH